MNSTFAAIVEKVLIACVDAYSEADRLKFYRAKA